MNLWHEIAALATVFALLGAAMWALGQRAGAMRNGAAKSLHAIERLALTPQHTLHLVRAAGRELVIATHPHGCTLVAEQPAPSSEIQSPKNHTAGNELSNARAFARSEAGPSAMERAPASLLDQLTRLTGGGQFEEHA